jgi:hypothetical protein
VGGKYIKNIVSARVMEKIMKIIAREYEIKKLKELY